MVQAWLGVWNSVFSDPGIGSEGPSTDHELIIIWLINCSLDATLIRCMHFYRNEPLTTLPVEMVEAT
jgi:hypothetical protein